MSTLRFKVVETAFNRKAVKYESPQESTTSYYGKYVFSRKKMYEYLPKDKCQTGLIEISKENQNIYDKLVGVYVIDGKIPANILKEQTDEEKENN